jgi:predicted RNA-binding protein YlxR (DUF448 family)
MEKKTKRMSKAVRQARPLPQRTCVGCGTVTSKREMIRVIRTPEGSVLADPSGKKPGRGAYLCAKRECWETGLRKGKLERSLKVSISVADAEALREFAGSLRLAEVNA